ncbi:conserved oligomeric Golgi complex subunit 7 [Diorhabda carinulata]|uniref:conserved oligomeric Golgi complex subunit 7 n=1 Tax=Diorhabda carinulata TaxID=1163345 RepID=UPI0025A2C489|nr:conserved oligomeric Golgi complex subunit 7 [Diorhabda carinulata]
MDISAFSNDDFDTKEWVNEILKHSEKAQDSNYTMSLVMKLQLYVQQVNNALEDTSQQVLASLPKILRDVKSLQQEAVLLKEKMATVRAEIEKIEHDTGQSISNIEKLDSMQNKLILAKQGLHESDNWTILVNDLEEVFDSKNIENISNKILGMQNSLKLLINLEDYENRRLQLEELKNRLEAISSPAIVQAFTIHNTEQSQMFVQIFSSIDRLPQLLKYYKKCQKDLLLQNWSNQLEIEQDESTIQLIHNYFNHLLSNWHTQYRWFNQVFTGLSAVQNLIDIYSDVLKSLNPTLNECIDTTLKQISVTDKLGLLGEIKQTTVQFNENLMSIIAQTAQVKPHPDELLVLRKSIFSHLIPYVNKYGSYEQANLLKYLPTLNCMKEELPDTIQSLGLSIPSVIDYCSEAKRRCKEITENCGYCGLLVALRAFLLGYADFYRVALRQIDRNKRSEEDWMIFQLCFSLLQNTGEVISKLQQFEKDLTNQILDLNQKETVNFKILLLNESDLKEFDSLVKCVTEGTRLSLLDSVTSEFVRLSGDIHHTTYQVVFAPISVHLDVVQAPNTWNQFEGSTMNDLPDYSFVPQEYITQIGQYLLILPQHLEPFLFKDNPFLSCALKSADQEYNNAFEGERTLAQVFLTIIADGTCQYFIDKILSICELSPGASRQLAHDISYLQNIFEELGLSLSDNLQQLSILLKIPVEQYQAQSSGCSARLVAAVRQMRNIKSAN